MWRGVILLEIVNNIYRSIMCGWLFKIISKHGVKCQFGSTPGVGCQDGTFTINTLINLRHNHNLPTWVAFADPVKAFDTSNYALLIAILWKHGALPRLSSSIKRMYCKKHSQAHHQHSGEIHWLKSGVKQGYIMALLLSLFLMMAFSDTLEYKWAALGISKYQFAHKYNSPIWTGQLVSHQPGNFSSGMILDLFCMLHVDHGAFVFVSRNDIKKVSPSFPISSLGSDLKCTSAQKKTSKNECVFSPLPGFFNTQKLLITYLTTFTFSI